MKKVRTRFAPSPTGYMHIGNLRTALYEYLIAKHNHGDFILRIEDTDQNRLVEGSLEIIYDTLKQVGLEYDEGPNKSGPYGPYIQSERLGIYADYAQQLVALKGAHYCFCDEESIAKQREDAEQLGIPFKFIDPCHDLSDEEIALNLAQKKPYVIRQTIVQDGEITHYHDEVYGDIDVPKEDLDESILLKSDGYPTYNFCNVIDDHLMEISHVVRGNEYLSSTPKYNLIYDSFGWERPIYVHCPPVMKDAHHKLSKRNGDASFQDLIQKGYLSEAVVNYIVLLGWSPETNQEIFSLEELVHAFNPDRISKAPAIFDIEKLRWMNGVYLRNKTEDEFYQLVLPYLNQSIHRECDLIEVAKILHPRVDVLGDIPEMVDFIDELPEYDTTMFFHKKMKTNRENSLLALNAAIETLQPLADFKNYDLVQQLIKALPEKLEVKNGVVFWPIRTALAGKQFTPGGALELPLILGKEETLSRLSIGIDKLTNYQDE